MNDKHTILVLGTSPSGLPRVSVAAEYRVIEQLLRSCERRDEFELHHALGVRAAELPGLLMRYRPDTLHFCGHATSDGELVFESASEGGQHADARAIARVFDALSDSVRCVVLNCCYSELQAREIADHVEVVIGMRGRLGDACGAVFAEGFYEALGFGRSYVEAFELALVRVELESLTEDERPVLYTGGQYASMRTKLPASVRGRAWTRAPKRARTAKVAAPDSAPGRSRSGPGDPVFRTITIGVAALLTLPLWSAWSDGRGHAQRCPSGFERTKAGYCLSEDRADEQVFVPAGPAFIGSDSDASARRRVVLDAFAIGRTEVSVARYLDCVASGACEDVDDASPSKHGTPSSFRVEDGAQLPANYLDWEDATAYCQWAGGALCTSEQWEKAAVGGCELYDDEATCEASWPRTPWGSSFSCEYAAFNDVPRSDPGCRSYHPRARPGAEDVLLWPVDAHPRGASPYGALNMIGNVWEWTADSVAWERGVGACSDCKDTRGGGVLSSREDARASEPNPALRDSRWAQRGARCCWSVE